MACTFSYTFDLSSDKKYVRFSSDKGEEYVLTHELTWTIYGNSILNIIVESNTTKDLLIIVELFSTNLNSFKSSAQLENNRALLNFQNVNFLTPDPWRCVIHVVPHLYLQDVQESPVASFTSVPTKRGLIQKPKLEQLSEDMQRILSSGDLSDVVLTDGISKIPAHKVILSARSPVFGRMFQHPMKENSENSVLISDVSEEVLKEFISFIYTGIITVKDMKMARNLYMVADKYAVIDLKAECSEILKAVSFEDVLDTLALADLYEDKVLKHASLDFISKNYSKVKSSKSWESFMKENQSLAIEILSFIIENRS